MSKQLQELTPSWRWFGPSDYITLKMIRSTGIIDIVSALEVPAGTAWQVDQLLERKTMIESAGCDWRVIESIPVSSDILLKTNKFSEHVENYCTSLESVAAVWKDNPPVVLYNAMLWADWYRTSFSRVLPDGQKSGEFIAADMELAMKPENIRTSIENMAKMRGWNAIYAVDDAINLLEKCQNITHQELWNNFIEFMSIILPIAQKLSIKLALHPDDPPRPIFGIPRIMSTAADYQKLFTTLPASVNGMCFCVGSLGANAENDLIKMIPQFADRIHNAHWRTVQRLDSAGSFYEAPHNQGSWKLAKVAKEFVKLGITCNYRSDHAEWYWPEIESKINDGYSGIGRFTATRYLQGVLDALKE